MKQKVWRFAKPTGILPKLLAKQLGLSEITAQILANRGIGSLEEARFFLTGELKDLHDPGELPDFGAAVQRIIQAIDNSERILVFGDYDVDGITSTVLLRDVLEKLGANCSHYIPDRLTEGYGLNINSLQKAKDDGVTLVVTVDCGISALEEVLWANTNGLDVIITDHHEPPEQIPAAIAVVNPKRADSVYPFKELAGVGVAFKLAYGLLRAFGRERDAYQCLDLVALGTVADMVPLHGENRILTKYGLPIIAKANRPGLKALLTVSGVTGDTVDSEQIAFGLAPRLNAVGRLIHAEEGVRLLRCMDADQAEDLAKTMDRVNKERQAVEGKIFEEAVQVIETSDMLQQKVLVVAGPGWHLGVVGIVASKLVNRYYRPVILLSVAGDQAKGSARSVPGFNLFNALQECAAYLRRFGGHSQAAGLTLAASEVDALRTAVNGLADEQLTEEHLVESLTIDGEVTFNEVTADLYAQLMRLAPFGFGNPSPMLACRQAEVVDWRTVGNDGKHLKLKIKNHRFILDAIGFNLTDCQEHVDLGTQLDVVFELRMNEWNGRSNLQLNVKDLKQFDRPDNPYVTMVQDGQQSVAYAADKQFIDDLFNHAAEYLVDDYYRNIGDKEEFFTKVVGVTFDNRQELVAGLKQGETLYLVREYHNTHDPNAVKVENHSGQQIGYLNARLAKHFAPLLDKGEHYLTLVSNVTGGDGKNYGVNIIIQKVQEKDFAEKRAILRETRERLKAMSDEKLNDAIRNALLGGNPYRDGQLNALDSLRAGNNTLAIFGTGRGKSAVFQTMAAWKAIRDNEVTVIVYPLRALVNDQFDAMLTKLTPLGLRIYKGNGSLSTAERAMLFAVLESGDIDILLTTPEFLSFHMGTLNAMPKKIGLFVVDESHHISMSSLSHRPAYKRMGEVARGLNNPLTLAVTATANDQVAKEIVETLNISSAVVDPYIRTNLQLVDRRGIEDKNSYIKQVLQAGGKTIIYVNSRTKSIELALMIREAMPEMTGSVVYYHAGLKSEDRHRIERMFKEGEIKVIVSTSAFGEGIDIPDVRHVILYHLNFNFTEFNQQSGRGGRDGNTTHVHLLCGDRDVRINEFILEMAAPDRDFLATLYSVLSQLKNGTEPLVYTNKELAEKMHKAGVRNAREATVSTGLGIIEELGLIQREVEGRNRRIYLNPFPDQKADLENSLRFIEGQEEKQAFKEFRQMFFASTSEELLSTINRPIYPKEMPVVS